MPGESHIFLLFQNVWTFLQHNAMHCVVTLDFPKSNQSNPMQLDIAIQIQPLWGGCQLVRRKGQVEPERRTSGEMAPVIADGWGGRRARQEQLEQWLTPAACRIHLPHEGSRLTRIYLSSCNPGLQKAKNTGSDKLRENFNIHIVLSLLY